MRSLSFLMFCAMASTGAVAQEAQVFGLIRDPSDASVVGAELALRNEQTGGTRNAKSNESGSYSFSALSPGGYRLIVRAVGFQTIVREGIQLDVGENARLDFDLTIGSSQNTITVHGGPPLINTSDASVGTVIDRNLIDQMPLNGRGIQTLVELAPGVTVVPVVDRNRGQFAINGQRSDANYFTVDGVSANFSVANSASLDFLHALTFSAGQAGGGMLPANNFLGTFSNLLSPEALEEFKIQTSTYAAEFGHLPGGQISLISRSGTNRYSGSLFEYLRNDATDANDWFNDMQGLAKPALRFNNFGGTFGGPVRLPHVYDGTNRTFFFFSADFLKIQQPEPAIAFLVPTLSARENAPPALATMLNAYPLPNDSSLGGTPALPGFAQFVGASSLRYDQRTYALRIDHNFSDKLGLFVRYSHAPSRRIESVGYLTPSNFDSYSIGTDSITVGLTQSFSSNWVNEIRLNASKQSAGDRAYLDDKFGGIPPAISQFLPPGYSSANSLVSFGVGARLAPFIYLGLLSKDEARQIQGLDNLSYSRGAHLFKFGVDYRWFSPLDIVPAYTLNLRFTGIYDSSGSFISTVPNIYTIVSASSKTVYAVPTFAIYAQDTWRLNPRFTINYGLRWEVAPAPHVTSGQALVAAELTNLNDLSTAHLLPAGQPFYSTTYGNFAPRVGIAWQLWSRGQMMTVLRTGAGLFLNSAQGGFEDSAQHGQNAFFYTNQPLGSLGTGTPSFAVNLDPVPIAAAPHYKLPLTYQWNFTLEQAIGQQTISVGYVGSVGRRLIGSVPVLSVPVLFTLTTPLHALGILGNNSSSSYNALQVQFNRRLSHRLQVLTSYTFSHSIDNLSQELPSFIVFPSLSQYLNPNADRGPSDFDIRHTLSGAVIVQLPSPKHGVAAAFLTNWSANGIFFVRSALPTNVRDPADLGLRPNRVAGQPLYLYGPQYPGGKSYNLAAFTDPPFNKEGDFGRNVLRGFGAWQLDLGMHRRFDLSERTSLEFRAEAFNVLNHPNFANPGDLGEPGSLAIQKRPTQWGESTAMLANGLGPTLLPGELNPLFQIGGPRTLQFALRLRY